MPRGIATHGSQIDAMATVAQARRRGGSGTRQRCDTVVPRVALTALGIRIAAPTPRSRPAIDAVDCNRLTVTCIVTVGCSAMGSHLRPDRRCLLGAPRAERGVMLGGNTGVAVAKEQDIRHGLSAAVAPPCYAPAVPPCLLSPAP